MTLRSRLSMFAMLLAMAPIHGVFAADAASSPPDQPAAGNVADAPQTKRFPGWYQWRGPEQDGVSREKNLPEKWSPDGENVLWTSDTGGMSSPIIMNDRLYTYTRVAEVPAGTTDEPTLAPGPRTQEALACVDGKTGKRLWAYTEPMYQTDVPFHRLGWSNPVGDPSTDRVYGLGSQCKLVCLDGKSGKFIWEHQMTEEYGLISTFGGRTPSPAIDEDMVILGGVAFGWGNDAGAQHRLFAFDKNNGQLRWTAGTGGIPVDAPYSTPVIAVINGQRLVITNSGDGGIHAFQARTGKKAWDFKGSLRGFNNSVVVDGNYVYFSHDLDNPDSTVLGRVYCVDASKIENGAPKEVWRIDGILAGFPSPTLAGDRLYVEDDGATVYAIDKKTGKVYWKKKCGRTGKASLVWGDDKLYVADGDGRFWILKDTGSKPQVLSKVELPDKLGREYAIFGSVAIDDGRIFLETANKTYCIGDKNRKPASDPIPPLAPEAPTGPNDPVAQVQVVPANVLLRPGEKVDLSPRTYDAMGRFLGIADKDKAKWSIGELTMPPPPKRPAAPASAGHPVAAAGGETSDEARAQLAAAATSKPAGPTKVGNLKGEVDAHGVYTAAAGLFQGGAVEATVGSVVGQSRVRVLPELPWDINFDASRIGTPPLTWIGAGGKFAVVDQDGNKVLQKLTNFDLYYRARTYFGSTDQTDYTVEGDVMANEKVMNGLHAIPDIGLINSRYVLVLLGNDQKLQAIAWPAAVPDARQPSGSINRTISFPWKAKTWYHMKLWVHPEGKVMRIKGKVWPRGEKEPTTWQVEMEDDLPNNHGSPGLFGNSLVGQQKSEIYYDNLRVTPNK